MIYVLLILALVFNLLAQSLLKKAVLQINVDSISVEFFTKIFVSPLIWGGAIFYGVSFLFYIMALSRGELSRISPVSQALTTVGVVLISVILFNEPLTAMKILGLLFLIGGTIILFI
ncbi:multidrug efflux SMR transporter [Paenibacillus sp. 2TAB26]|uniref:DMT family transporter n=1 Tax=Paenibacillus sp. 2TAB26 TaxID=3233005 RepID=UPI003F94C617